MRALLAVMVREVSERRLVLVAAAAVALLPFGAPFLPGVESHLDGDARDASAGLLAYTITALAGLGFGAVLFPNSPRFRGLGFFLARPLPAATFWAGKVEAACGMALLVGVIIVAPAEIAGAERILSGWDDVGPLLLLAVATVPAGHLLALAFRSRSPLILVDFVVWVLVSNIWVRIAFRLFDLGLAWRTVNSSALVYIGAVVIGLLMASLATVRAGRADVKRGRRLASMVLATCQITCLPAMAVWIGWIVTATPAGFTDVDSVNPAPRGNWVVVNGRARGAHSRQLVDLETGDFSRAGNVFGHEYNVLSPDGTHALLSEDRHPDEGYNLASVSLSSHRPMWVAEAVSSSFPSRSVFDAQGSKLATSGYDGPLTIHSFPALEVLCEVPLPSARSPFLFVDDQTVRIWSVDDETVGEVEVNDLSVETCEFTSVGEAPRFVGAERMGVTPAQDGRRFLVFESATGRAALYGEAGGQPLFVTEDSRGRRSWPQFLSDGTVLRRTSAIDHSWLDVLARDGTVVRSLEFPEAETLLVSPEIEEGVVVVTAEPESQHWWQAPVFRVDLAAGTATEIGVGMAPVRQGSRWQSMNSGNQPAPGAPSTRLFLRAEAEKDEAAREKSHPWSANVASLVRLDPWTGEQEVLLGPGR